MAVEPINAEIKPLTFADCSPPTARKNHAWGVNEAGGIFLGKVQWAQAKKKYVFSSYGPCWLDSDELSALSAFTDEQTRARLIEG